MGTPASRLVLLTIEELSNKRSFLEEEKELQKTVRTLYVPDKYWSHIDQIAERSGVSKSYVVREILSHVVEGEEL